MKNACRWRRCCDLADVFDGGMVPHDARLERRRIRDIRDQAIDGAGKQRLVDEDVRASREPDERL